MRVLVGMPAYKLEYSVFRTINSMKTAPVDILVIDNNSAEDVKSVLKGFAGRIQIIENKENRGCNGAWNQIMKYGLEMKYDVIGLQTDTIMDGDWWTPMKDYLATHPKEVVITNIIQGERWCMHNHTFHVSGSPMTFYPREAVEQVYPIPAGLKHWFGDTYMFVELRKKGWTMTVVADVRAYHSWSEVAAVSSEELNQIVPADKAEFRRLYPDIVFE